MNTTTSGVHTSELDTSVWFSPPNWLESHASDASRHERRSQTLAERRVSTFGKISRVFHVRNIEVLRSLSCPAHTYLGFGSIREESPEIDRLQARASGHRLGRQ